MWAVRARVGVGAGMQVMPSLFRRTYAVAVWHGDPTTNIDPVRKAAPAAVPQE